MYHNVYTPKIHILRNSVFVCFLWFSEESENISEYSMILFVITTETQRVWLIIEVSATSHLKRQFNGSSC